MKQLYPHQRDAVDETLSSIMFGSTEIILEAPVSFGKSIYIAEMCKQLDGSIAILVSFEPLINQIAEELDELGVDYSILKAGREDEFTENHKVQLCMAQTLYARVDKISMKCDYVIMDEYHIAYNSKRTTTILDKLEPKVKIGCTATPYNSRGYKLSDDAEYITTISTKDLTDNGYLCPVKYYIPKWSEEVDYSKVKSTGNDYTLSALDEITSSHKHLDLVLKSMNDMGAKDKKTLVFCSTIEQCDLVANMLKENGYYAEAYHSKIDKKLSESIMYAFKKNTNIVKKQKDCSEDTLFSLEEKTVIEHPVKCLISVSRLSIGFSVKDIQLGVMLRPTKVRSLFQQIVGRLCRTHPNKEYAEFLDLAQVTSKFGFHTEPYQLYSESEQPIKEAIDKQKEMSLLGSLISSTEPQEITRDIYNTKVVELRQKEEEIFNGGEAEPKEYADVLRTTDDIYRMVYAGAKLHTMAYGRPISKKGNRYDYNIDWLCENILLAFKQYPSEVERWTKSYRTRIRNIIKEGKNFNSVRFFIDYLVSKYEEEEEYNNYSDFKEISNINEDEIPF